MSVDERQSPRAAIRKWLSHTVRKPKPDVCPTQRTSLGQSRNSRRRPLQPSSSVDIKSPTRGRREEDRKRKRKRKRSGDESRGHSKLAKDENRATAPTLREGFPESKRSDSHLAEHLGLHPPFRGFEHHDNDLNIIKDAPNRPRKRRRSLSSMTSYLRPAATIELGTSREQDHAPAETSRAKNKFRKCDERNTASWSQLSQGSSAAVVLKENPVKTYERRSRHKTREDRYDLMKNRMPTKKKKEDTHQDKKPRKRKRNNKSGAALMHDFTAQNISHDRLTLQPTKSLGLFGKGRASSPVKRRGLPDLAFSELTFLNSRRERPDDVPKPASSKKKRKASKAADTEAEISRYFKGAKVADQDTPGPSGDKTKHDENRQVRRHHSPPPLVDLPDRPFLGFGSCGVNSVSPMKMAREQDARYNPSLSPRDTFSPSRSTSYLTWSRSGTPAERSDQRNRTEVQVLHSSRHSKRGRSSTSREIKYPKAHTPCLKHDSLTKECVRELDSAEVAGGALGISNSLTELSNAQRSKSKKEVEDQQDARHAKNDGYQQQIEKRLLQVPIPNSTHEIKHQLDSCGTIGLARRIMQDKAENEQPAREAIIGPRSIDSGLRDPQEINPLEAALETLLQNCKPQTTDNVLTSASWPADLVTDVPSAFGQSDSPLYPANKVDSQAIYFPSTSRLASPAFRIDSITEPTSIFSQRGHIYKSPRSPKSGLSLSTTALHALHTRQSTRPSPQYPDPSRNLQANSRSAWNGYETIYERQKRTEIVGLEGLKVYSPYVLVSHEDLRNLDPPAEDDNMVIDHVHGLYTAEDEGQDESAYFKHASVGDYDMEDQEQHHGYSNAVYDDRQADRDDLHSGESYAAADPDIVDQLYEEKVQSYGQDRTLYRPDYEESIKDVPTCSLRSTSKPACGIIDGRQDVVEQRFEHFLEDQGDDMALAGFWRPHKHY